MAWQDLKSKGLHNMPGVPVASTANITDTLARLRKREGEVRPAMDGLSVNYTIGGHTASAYDFLYGNPALKNLSLDDPKQFAISWTTYKDIYKDAMRGSLQPFSESLTDPRGATTGFWNNIAAYGTAYNLLILRRVTDTRLAELKLLFHGSWQRLWTDSDLNSLQQKGRLYELDFSMFEALGPYYFDNRKPRHNPATVTLLVRDANKIGHFEPVLIRVWTSKRADVYTHVDAAWLYALQAAKTSVTLYGIWLGHVYHWHIVSAAMQGTMYNTIPSGHVIYQLLKPQSDFLIGFDYTLLNKFFLGALDLFSQIAPPSSVGDADVLLKLMDRFAAGRQFFDDDPKSELARNGLEEAHFTREKPWDMYPAARHMLLVWDICERFVQAVVSGSYADDRAVAADTALQSWMKQSADTGQGNIRGLPVMDNRGALTRVLTSLVYRFTIHGVSRLSHTANPDLTWVANFPPCLQRGDNPWPHDALSTQELLTYMPNTGTIGEMLKFYFAFAFSKPYIPLLPQDGNPDFYFPGDIFNNPKNAALVKFRMEMAEFIRSEYKWWNKPNFPDTAQWPRNIET